MSAALTPAELDRLRNILARLGSDFDGERAAAGLLASRLLRDKGLAWDGVVMPAPPPPCRPAAGRSWQDDAPSRDDWRDLVGKCCRHLHLLNDFERGFLDNIQLFPRLSQKQESVLNRIVAKLKANGCRV
jgi:hypothetical protein